MWSSMDNGWNTYRFSACNYVPFLGSVQPKSIEVLIGEVMVRFSFGHVVIIRWVCAARQCHVSSARGLNV